MPDVKDFKLPDLGEAMVSQLNFWHGFSVYQAAVLEQAPQAATARQKLEKDFQPRKDEIITAQKKVQKLEQNLVRDADTMSESARRLLERDIISRKRDLRRVQEEYREDLNLRRNEELVKFLT